MTLPFSDKQLDAFDAFVHALDQIRRDAGTTESLDAIRHYGSTFARNVSDRSEQATLVEYAVKSTWLALRSAAVPVPSAALQLKRAVESHPAPEVRPVGRFTIADLEAHVEPNTIANRNAGIPAADRRNR